MYFKNLGANCALLSFSQSCVLVLLSYGRPVAVHWGGRYYRTSTKWSVTTARHINKFLDGAPAIVLPQASFDILLSSANVDMLEFERVSLAARAHLAAVTESLSR